MAPGTQGERNSYPVTLCQRLHVLFGYVQSMRCRVVWFMRCLVLSLVLGVYIVGVGRRHDTTGSSTPTEDAALAVFVLAASLAQSGESAHVEFNSRHVCRYVKPTLPAVARKMSLKGMVKLQTEISAGGKVSVNPLGGHPEVRSAPQPATAVITVSFE